MNYSMSGRAANNAILSIIFYMAFLPLYIVKLLGLLEPSSDYYIFYEVAQYLALLLLMVGTLFVISVSYQKVMLISILLLVIAYISLITTDYTLLSSLLFILCAKYLNIKDFLHKLFGFTFFVFSIDIGVFLFNYFNETASFQSYIENGVEIIRYDFGHPSVNAIALKAFVFIYLYLFFRQKINLWDIIFLMAVAYFIYSFSLSRTGFFVSILTVLLVYLHQYVHFLHAKAVQFLFYMSFSIFTLMSYFSVIYYGKGIVFLDIVNQITSRRLSYAYTLSNDLGVSLFPRNIKPYIRDNFNPVDNSYVYMIYSSGILFSIFFIFVLSKLMKVFLEQRLYKEAIIFLCIGAYALSERMLFDIANNLLLIFLVLLIFRQKIIRV